MGAIALGGGVTVVCLLPVFLTGAMAVQVTRDLAFGSAALGVAVAMQRAAGAAFGVYLGRVADRLGATRSIRLAALIAAGTALGIALTAFNWAVLAAWLAISGCAQALGQPAANRLLSNVVRRDRLGTAFGLKQSAPPAATMLAGLSVPAIALTLGWRWAYALAAVLSLAMVFATRRPPPMTRGQRQPITKPPKLENRRMILLLAVAFGLGTSTSSAVTTFYVDAAVEAGTAQQFAGTMLAVASVAAISFRVLSGAASDRLAGGHLRLCAALLAGGALGVPLLATGRPALMAVGVVIALAGTWGFNGVFWYTLVSTYPETPGRITGALAPGGHLGGIAGPILFGVVAQSGGYPLAWALMGSVTVAAAGAMLFAAAKLPHRPRPRTGRSSAGGQPTGSTGERTEA